MGWLIAVLVVIAILAILGFAAPELLGPVVAGLAPLLLVVALIGLGGVWWRHSRHRVDPEAEADQDGELDRRIEGDDDRVET